MDLGKKSSEGEMWWTGDLWKKGVGVSFPPYIYIYISTFLLFQGFTIQNYTHLYVTIQRLAARLATPTPPRPFSLSLSLSLLFFLFSHRFAVSTSLSSSQNPHRFASCCSTLTNLRMCAFAFSFYLLPQVPLLFVSLSNSFTPYFVCHTHCNYFDFSVRVFDASVALFDCIGSLYS